jgi:cystathionine beta-lyase family protein involved in aluminum resistance
MKSIQYSQYLGVAILVVGLTTSCSGSVTEPSYKEDDMSMTSHPLSTEKMNDQTIEKTIAEAKKLLYIAKEEGYAWRDTGKFIKQAEKSLSVGNIAKASSLAVKAVQQSQLAKQQSIEQESRVKARFN